MIASPILDKKISITDPMGGATSQITTSNFKDTFSQYFIIVKELNEREKRNVADIGFSVHSEKANGYMYRS